MILIIDAYNVLKTMHGTHNVRPRDLRNFIERVMSRAACRGYRVYIVFDGGEGGRAREEQGAAGSVIYVGSALTADDGIYRLAEELRGHETVVVSADRGLRSRVSKVGAKLLDPAILWRVLYPNEVTASSSSPRDGTLISAHKEDDGRLPAPDAELAHLLVTAPCELKDEEQTLDHFQQRTRSGYTASKSTKRMARIVERL